MMESIVSFLFAFIKLFYVNLYSDCSDIENEEREEPPLKRSKKPFHNILPLEDSQLNMNWTIVRVHGVGLINRGTTKESLNICYSLD